MKEPQADERELLRELADGRESAYARLYDRWGGALYATALRITGSREEAEDTVQELFTSLVRSRKHLPGVGSLRGYLFTSLRRSAARSASVSPPQPAGSARRSSSSGASLIRSIALDRAVAGLPRDQREVLSLKIDGGLTFAEIAAALEISPNTAASRYRYALEKLRTLLKDV